MWGFVGSILGREAGDEVLVGARCTFESAQIFTQHRKYPELKLKTPAWVFCMSWRADFAFRKTWLIAIVNIANLLKPCLSISGWRQQSGRQVQQIIGFGLAPDETVILLTSPLRLY